MFRTVLVFFFFLSNTALAAEMQRIVVAGGCFWGVQAVFQHTKGVVSAVSGYAGGEEDTAHYEIVGTGRTGHAESVQITYNPEKITLDELLSIYFTVAHNPTQLNYQGPDHGTQYRSAVFYNSVKQRDAVQEKIDAIVQGRQFANPVVTQLEPLEGFYPAEPYHQNFATLHPDNPYIVTYDAPKLVALQKTFPGLYVEH